MPPRSRHALVVEDDPAIRELLRLHLDLAGFTIAEAADGRRGLELTRASPFDLVLLDVMLPGLDGVTLCRAIRGGTVNPGVPILMLTARDAEADKVLGLENGADDYLTKPFGVRELLARIGALMRRHDRGAEPAAPVDGPLRLAQLTVDRQRREVVARGVAVELTRQEFDLLALLAARPGMVFTRAARSSVTRRTPRCCSRRGAWDTSSPT